jgi:hemerythrin-like domain-containing protein
MLREVDAIARMIRALAPGDRVRPKRLREWLRFVERTFHHHHTVEDRYFFPMLLRKDPGFSEAMASLDAEHAELDPLLRETCNGLKRLSEVEESQWGALRDEVADCAARFHESLGRHLLHEEQEVIARSRAHLNRFDMETFNRRAMRQIPVHDMRTVVPWLLETCTEEERRRAMGNMPWGARMLVTWVWQPWFKRRTEALRS